MSVYITKVCGLGGTAGKGQQVVANEAKKFGIEEIRIPYYDYFSDSKDSLYKRIDGILTGVSENDTVILQSPTWNYPNFESALIGHLKAINNLKLIIFIHDIRAMMFPIEAESMPFYVELFNTADRLIVPSDNMAQHLKEMGVSTPMTVQYLWDFNNQVDLIGKPNYENKIVFVGDDEKFRISTNFPIDSDTTLELYGRKNEQMQQANNIHYHGFLDEYSLLQELHKGGFGLVWSEDEQVKSYMHYCNSYKVSTYLQAGIPLIVHSSISCRKLVEDNHWGIVVDSLEEAVQKVKTMSADEYHSYVDAIATTKYILENGYYTKRALVDAVYNLFITRRG
ncbi:nucleotide sugar synthetase [Lactobacillus salivarius]|uniref:Glucosyltransferase 3 n=1 Tax=Ligilactobacillus salivarius TaxID=1624 RepID=A0A6A8LN76_9LACO|nr:nucleotide sugar synthetase [Ligilactobacillus salivarius]MSE07027.1 nucleotide sugar synthetase [Ligilactobacillus salivarius]MSE07643.1 nucleotide sugar synthetase [Ligilactobacillus salivarius]